MNFKFHVFTNLATSVFLHILTRNTVLAVITSPQNYYNPVKKFSDMFGQFAATTQFYLYGRKHCTKTGWLDHSKHYEKPDILAREGEFLKGKVYMVTGANAGIGREISLYLAKKGASVYMICRNPARAEAARVAIISETKNENVKLLICDCSIEEDVRRMWKEFTQMLPEQRLDGLVCNAGLLANEKTLTKEGVEITFAVHLLFGTYLLGKLAIPLLQTTPDSRFVTVSSGGMYNTKFPTPTIASNSGDEKYDGKLAYAYAKRGQVLLMEQWTKLYPTVKFVSCHPGWTQTEGVDAAFGETKKYLEPLRTLWEGAEGIVYLLVEDVKKIEGGAFYLDRKPQVKHMAGMFNTEGTFTKNTDKEIQEMMSFLETWSSADTRPTLEEQTRLRDLNHPLKPTTTKIDIPSFMGNWYVLANIPTPFEVGASNCIEHYDWDKVHECIQVTFTYQSQGSTSPSTALMRGYIHNAPINTQWSMNPKLGIYLPLGLTYIIPYIAPDQSYVLVSVPDRSYLWIMTRARPLPKTSHTTTSSTTEATTCTYLSAEEQDRIYTEAVRIAKQYGFPEEKIQRVRWT